MRLLLIEDDAEIAHFLRRGLEAEGYTVSHAGTAREGEALACTGACDAIILDLMLPDGHGRDVCRVIRDAGVASPVLMLTALDALDDKVTGLRAGADDYLCKPFEFEELLARIEALIRRGHGQVGGTVILTVSDLTLDTDKMRVWRGSREIILTSKEFALLELLMRRADMVFSRDQILDQVWGYHHDTRTNVVEVCMGRVRKKVDLEGEPPLIHTIRGRGYKIAPVNPSVGS